MKMIAARMIDHAATDQIDTRLHDGRDRGYQNDVRLHDARGGWAARGTTF